PIASRQLVQDKLVNMVADHTSGLLRAWRLAKLKDEGRLHFSQVSLAKRENVRAALDAARSAREILGGSGITLDYHSIRHMLNLETVDTYEGTHDIHTLIVGREVTGLEGF
ncbi:MAG: acyl-CoA dehydrogenase family protein, partial [Acidobacteria bacterium]|nr:acyl-CoA dehydrogenase family protein [Acidobacteriota bacterium]